VSSTESLPARLWSKRKRFAPVVLVVGAAVVGLRTMDAVPKNTEITFGFGPEHADVKAANISYLLDGEAAARVEFHWPAGAPKVVDHSVTLAKGQYEVRAELDEGPTNHVVVLRKLRIPAQGRVHIDLFDMAYVQNGHDRAEVWQ